MKKKIVMGGGNTPSGDITIDDVVKFIHDAITSVAPDMFPYTTWDSIPNYDDAESGTICKSSSDDDNFETITLNIPSYVIGIKEERIG